MADGGVPIASPNVGPQEREAVMDVLESGYLAAGEAVREFETAFADYCDVSHAVATANGTTALHAALHAVGVEPGSTVVTTPFSFVATANSIRFAGGIPVFGDVDPETLNLDPESVAALIDELDEEVDAILAVHLYGLPADVKRLREIADRHDVPLVEDAAQAHGATVDGRPVGSFGDAAAFSFYPTKNMTTGEGGMVTTDRHEVASAVRRFIDHGRAPGHDYEHVELGHNYRMTNLAAAIGKVQLERLPGFVEARRENARRLTDRLASAGVSTPVEPDGRRHAYNQYTIRCRDRESLRQRLDERGVGNRVYYPTCIHDLEAYDHFSVTRAAAERAAEEVLSVPVHPDVDEDDVDRIAAIVREEAAIDA